MIMMKGIQTQASIALMLARAIQGCAKKRWIVRSHCPRQRCRRTETILHERLADHPAHGDGAEHHGQRESDTKELPAAYLGAERQSQCKGDRILGKHGHGVKDHIAKRVPVVVIVKQCDEIVEAVEVWALERTEIPIQ
jgi:hypothetical protein